MENRFLPPDLPLHPAARRALRTLRPLLPPGSAPSFASSLSTARTRRYAQSLSADKRALVILIENGGIDLGIPELADKLLEVLPQSALIPQSVRQQLVVFLRDTIKGFTDDLLESAELAVNRYSAAAPEFFASVTVLRNGTASHDELRAKLFALAKEGKVIDLLILTHGRDDEIAVNGGITGDKIRRMRADLGQPLPLRSVYMMNCVGASLNQAWIDAGAKVSSGAIRNNYLPEPTTFFFWQNWKQGQEFEAAVTGAYRKTINVLNEAVRGFIGSLPLPGAGSFAGLVDFEKMQFVQDSAPVIQGQRSVSIGSDDLTFTQSLSSRMATTVLPVHLLGALQSSRAASLGGAAVSRSFTYRSPSTTAANGYSRMQNPAAVIAGIAVTDALQIGLGATALVQSQVNASGGSFQLTYDATQRLLTNEARQRMPGAQQPSTEYLRPLMSFGHDYRPVADHAFALVIIVWQGNAYGEISTPVIRRDLSKSSDWTQSSASFAIKRIDRPPEPGMDPRAYPLRFHYDGSYDPVFNGKFEFQGEFEINAFGGLKFNHHEVVSRSMIDVGTPEEQVAKGEDVIVAVPTIPQDQVNFLKSTLP